MSGHRMPSWCRSADPESLVRCHPRQEEANSHVLGVVDWAIRKGQTYGTILVDHIQGRVIDLLPDRVRSGGSHAIRRIAHPKPSRNC